MATTATNATETTMTTEMDNLTRTMQELGYTADQINAKVAEIEASAKKPIRSTFRAVIYRNCSCGETAHDYATTNTYACRNCGTTRTVRRRNA